MRADDRIGLSACKLLKSGIKNGISWEMQGNSLRHLQDLANQAPTISKASDMLIDTLRQRSGSIWDIESKFRHRIPDLESLAFVTAAQSIPSNLERWKCV
jgi:hypothetical protein